jgi:hypothetical protein
MSSEDPRIDYPQLTTTSGFLCDRCGEPIGDPSVAWGQWLSAPSTTQVDVERNWKFSIVHGEAHSPRCTLETTGGPSMGDCQLAFLLSADGLSYLLEFFVSREVDPEELSCFLMRLFIPGYEQVYRHISAAIEAEVYEPGSHRLFVTQSEIRAITARFSRRRRDS